MDLLVNIDVPDLAEGVAFYTRAFGLNVTRQLGAGVAELSGLPARLYLLQKPPGSIGAGTPLDPDRGRRLRARRIPRVPRQRGGHRARLQAPQGRAADGDRPRSRRPADGRRRRGPQRCATSTPAIENGRLVHRSVARSASRIRDRTGRPLCVPAAQRRSRLGRRRPRRRIRSPIARRTGRLDRRHPGALGPDRGRREDRHEAGAGQTVGAWLARPEFRAASITTPRPTSQAGSSSSGSPRAG